MDAPFKKGAAAFSFDFENLGVVEAESQPWEDVHCERDGVVGLWDALDHSDQELWRSVASSSSKHQASLEDITKNVSLLSIVNSPDGARELEKFCSQNTGLAHLVGFIQFLVKVQAYRAAVDALSKRSTSSKSSGQKERDRLYPRRSTVTESNARGSPRTPEPDGVRRKAEVIARGKEEAIARGKEVMALYESLPLESDDSFDLLMHVNVEADLTSGNIERNLFDAFQQVVFTEMSRTDVRNQFLKSPGGLTWLSKKTELSSSNKSIVALQKISSMISDSHLISSAPLQPELSSIAESVAGNLCLYMYVGESGGSTHEQLALDLIFLLTCWKGFHAHLSASFRLRAAQHIVSNYLIEKSRFQFPFPDTILNPIFSSVEQGSLPLELFEPLQAELASFLQLRMSFPALDSSSAFKKILRTVLKQVTKAQKMKQSCTVLSLFSDRNSMCTFLNLFFNPSGDHAGFFQVLKDHDLPTMEQLLKKGHPDIQDVNGFYPLHLAVRAGSEAMVSLLLSYHARCDVRSRSGLTPLDFACMGGYNSIAVLLLRAGADTDSVTTPMADIWPPITPLHQAYFNKHYDTLALFLMKVQCTSMFSAKELFLLSLITQLDLSSCGLTTLSRSLLQFHGIHRLNLAHNKFIVFDFDWLLEFRSLKQVDLSGNPLVGVSPALESLCVDAPRRFPTTKPPRPPRPSPPNATACTPEPPTKRRTICESKEAPAVLCIEAGPMWRPTNPPPTDGPRQNALALSRQLEALVEPRACGQPALGGPAAMKSRIAEPIYQLLEDLCVDGIPTVPGPISSVHGSIPFVVETMASLHEYLLSTCDFISFLFNRLKMSLPLSTTPADLKHVTPRFVQASPRLVPLRRQQAATDENLAFNANMFRAGIHQAHAFVTVRVSKMIDKLYERCCQLGGYDLQVRMMHHESRQIMKDFPDCCPAVIRKIATQPARALLENGDLVLAPMFSKEEEAAIEAAREKADPSDSLDLLSSTLFTVEEVAREILAYQYSLFRAIPVSEWMYDRCLKRTKSPHYHRLVDTNNAIAELMASAVLRTESLTHRLFVLRRTVSLATALFRQSNFFAASSFVAGFDQFSIHRLHQTQRLLGDDTDAELRTVREFMHHNNNFKTYRSAIRIKESPCIPLMYPEVRDLTYLEQMETINKGIVNIGKFKGIYTIISDFERLRAVSVQFSGNAHLQALVRIAMDLNNPVLLHPNEQSSLSMNIEPRLPKSQQDVLYHMFRQEQTFDDIDRAVKAARTHWAGAMAALRRQSSDGRYLRNVKKQMAKEEAVVNSDLKAALAQLLATKAQICLLVDQYAAQMAAESSQLRQSQGLNQKEREKERERERDREREKKKEEKEEKEKEREEERRDEKEAVHQRDNLNDSRGGTADGIGARPLALSNSSTRAYQTKTSSGRASPSSRGSTDSAEHPLEDCDRPHRIQNLTRGLQVLSAQLSHEKEKERDKEKEAAAPKASRKMSTNTALMKPFKKAANLKEKLKDKK